MSTQNTETTFSALDRITVDIGTWKTELRQTSSENLDEQVRDQLLHNVAPFFEGMMTAVKKELSELGIELVQQGEALQEVIDQEEGFLRPEMASDLTATFLIGMAIVEILDVEGVTLENELKNKQLKDAMKLYKQNATICLEQIEEITDEGDDDDDDRNETAVHGQGEVSGSDAGDDGADGDDDAGADAGSDEAAVHATTGADAGADAGAVAGDDTGDGTGDGASEGGES